MARSARARVQLAIGLVVTRSVCKKLTFDYDTCSEQAQEPLTRHVASKSGSQYFVAQMPPAHLDPETGGLLRHRGKIRHAKLHICRLPQLDSKATCYTEFGSVDAGKV